MQRRGDGTRGQGRKEAAEHRATPRVSLYALLSLLVLLSMASLSLCAQSLVRCDALVGWNGVARGERFAPLLVTVDNPGPRLSARIDVRVLWGSSLRGTLAERTLTREALVTAGATRRIPFVIPLPRDARTLSVRVSSGGAELARDEVDLRSVSTEDRLVAAVSSELSFDFLSGLSDRVSAVRTVYPRVDDLPESWAGYDGVEMVVVHDTYFQQLRAAQVAALERWVASGGVLVFTGGADALQLASAGFARLLPVEVTGIRQRGDLASVASFLQLPRGPRGNMVIAESRLLAGTVRASQDGLPLLVQRRLGQGAIWFAAFDPTLPPLDSWDGSLSLWRIMIENSRPPTLESAFVDPVDDTWMKALFANPPLSFPTPLFVLALAGGYVALLVPLVVGRFSRWIGARARIALLLAIPLAASVTGWLAFNRMLFRPGAQALEASTVEMVSGDGLALVTEKLGLFTARAETCQFALTGADSIVDEVSPLGNAARVADARARDASPRQSGPDGLVIDAGRTTTVRNVSFGRFGSRLFLLKAVVALPIRVSVSESECVIANASPWAIRGCFLSRNGRGFPMGDVAAGATVRATLQAADGVSLGEPLGFAKIAGGARKADFISRAGAQGRETAVVMGWLDRSVLAVELDGAESVPGRPPLTLVMVEAR
jgi:hypothetical protein